MGISAAKRAAELIPLCHPIPLTGVKVLVEPAGSQRVRVWARVRCDWRTLAGWVAANVLDETRITNPLPAVGKRDGRTRLGNRDWRLSLQVQATDDADMRRLDVQVFAWDATEPSSSLTGFGSSQPSP